MIQKLSNGEKIQHYYSNLTIEGKFIRLPLHEVTGDVEILFLNNGSDTHSEMVTQIFARVATA